MSASEKLKALDARIAPAHAWPLDEEGTVGMAGGNMVAVSSLRLALPQIVAVVEAAENCYDEEIASGYIDGPSMAMGAALSALEEALS